MPSRLVVGICAGVAAVVVIGGVALWATHGSSGPSTPEAAVPSAVSTTAAGTALPSGSSSASGSTSAATATEIPAPQSTQALCEVREPMVKNLLAGARATARYESLRDAIPELNDRLQDVRAAAQGRPALQPVVVAVQAVYDDWSTALSAYDDGDRAAGARALASADRRIDGLDQTVPVTTSACPA